MDSGVLSMWRPQIPVGVKSGPELLLNPSLTYVMQDADELLVLAEDDDTYKPEHPVRKPLVVCPVVPHRANHPDAS